MNRPQIECISCGHIHNMNHCPSCNAQGGFLQTPKSKQAGGMQVHLREILIHKESKNEFVVKEIQGSGILCFMTISMAKGLFKPNQKFYISDSQLHEYERK